MQLKRTLAVAALATFGYTAPASAALIGNMATITCTAQFPSTDTDCLVGGGPDEVLVGSGAEGEITSGTNNVTIDILANSIVLSTTDGANFNAMGQVLVFSNLNFGHPDIYITGVNTSVTAGFIVEDSLLDVSFGNNSVTINFGNSGWLVDPTAELTIDIESTPEPSSILLFGAGLTLAVGLLRKRQTS